MVRDDRVKEVFRRIRPGGVKAVSRDPRSRARADRVDRIRSYRRDITVLLADYLRASRVFFTDKGGTERKLAD